MEGEGWRWRGGGVEAEGEGEGWRWRGGGVEAEVEGWRWRGGGAEAEGEGWRVEEAHSLTNSSHIFGLHGDTSSFFRRASSLDANSSHSLFLHCFKGGNTEAERGDCVVGGCMWHGMVKVVCVRSKHERGDAHT